MIHFLRTVISLCACFAANALAQTYPSNQSGWSCLTRRAGQPTCWFAAWARS